MLVFGERLARQEVAQRPLEEVAQARATQLHLRRQPGGKRDDAIVEQRNATSTPARSHMRVTLGRSLSASVKRRSSARRRLIRLDACASSYACASRERG